MNIYGISMLSAIAGGVLVFAAQAIHGAWENKQVEDWAERHREMQSLITFHELGWHPAENLAQGCTGKCASRPKK